MAISDDNTLLATSSSDETIRIWNVRTSKLISVLKLKLPPRVNYHYRSLLLYIINYTIYFIINSNWIFCYVFIQ